MSADKCGATRDFGKGMPYEGLLIAICEKPAGHDKRGWHRAQSLTLSTPGGTKPKGGRVEWNGDDRGEDK